MPNLPEQLNSIFFSVIIPLYNKGKSVRSTIESVLNQTYTNFELIIVNDGSIDDSLAVVQSFEDNRIRIINKTNGGVSSARNRGIKESIYEYITFLDADDLWFPNCLQEFSELILSFPNARVYATNYNMTGKNFKGSSARYYVEDFYLTSAIFMAKWNIPVMLTGCVALKKDCFNDIDVYNESVTHGEDIDLWLRLANRFTIAKSEVLTTLYRMDAENRASDINQKDKKLLLQKVIIKSEIESKSLQLFYGCEFLNSLVNNIRYKQNIKESIKLLKYGNWILRAAILYSKYRVYRLA